MLVEHRISREIKIKRDKDSLGRWRSQKSQMILMQVVQRSHFRYIAAHVLSSMPSAVGTVIFWYRDQIGDKRPQWFGHFMCFYSQVGSLVEGSS